MDEEYNEDQIGELHDQDIGAQDQVGQKLLEHAVDDFIEDKQGRFRALHKEFTDKDDPQIQARSMQFVKHADYYKPGEDPEEAD